MAGHGSKRVILLALAANAGIAASKFFAFALTRSSSLLAEAIHSVADTGNQLLLLFGLKKAAKPPDERHPFGYKMESYFWSFIVAVMLFTLGGLFALYEGMHKLAAVRDARAAGEPFSMPHPEIAYGVLLVSMALEGYSWFAATGEINRVRGKEKMSPFIQGSKSTEIIVIWMEDTGALIGLLLSLTGVTLTLLTKNPVYDVYATFAIGTLLIGIAFIVARKTKSLLIGESATNETKAAIRRIVGDTDGVSRLITLRTMQLGEDEILAAIKIEWQSGLTAETIADITNQIERDIRAGLPQARYLFIETDVYRSAEEASLATPD